MFVYSKDGLAAKLCIQPGSAGSPLNQSSRLYGARFKISDCSSLRAFLLFTDGKPQAQLPPCHSLFAYTWRAYTTQHTRKHTQWPQCGCFCSSETIFVNDDYVPIPTTYNIFWSDTAFCTNRIRLQICHGGDDFVDVARLTRNEVLSSRQPKHFLRLPNKNRRLPVQAPFNRLVSVVALHWTNQRCLLFFIFHICMVVLPSSWADDESARSYAICIIDKFTFHWTLSQRYSVKQNLHRIELEFFEVLFGFEWIGS